MTANHVVRANFERHHQRMSPAMASRRCRGGVVKDEDDLKPYKPITPTSQSRALESGVSTSGSWTSARLHLQLSRRGESTSHELIPQKTPDSDCLSLHPFATSSLPSIPRAQPHIALPTPTMSESLTTKQVAEHASVDKGLYIIIDSDVYKMDTFVDEHPGGAKILKRVGGKDASKQFWKVRVSRTTTVASGTTS